MSLFQTMAITCPSCEELIEFEAAGSVNADRRPDLRDAIIDNTFQEVECPSCNDTMRLEPEFNYLDMELGLWVGAFPARKLGQFEDLQLTTAALFDENYGQDAGAAGEDIGSDLAPRLTFGWPAVREKLYLARAGLDDVTVEMLKLDLIRRLPEAPLTPGVELRVVSVDETTLNFVWLYTMSEQAVGAFGARREMYDAISDAVEDWSAVRSSLTDSMFVDMQKMYLGARSAA